VHPSELFWRQLRFSDFDVSEMSFSSLLMARSAKRSYRQKSSDGCTGLGMSAIPSGLTLPSKIGQVLGFEAIAMLSGMFTVALLEESVPGNFSRGS